MLTFRQIDDAPLAVQEIIGETEQTIINDMARRIARLGGITDSTQYQMERLQAIGTQHDFIVQEFARALHKLEPEVIRMFDEAATRTLASDDAIYIAAGYSPVPLSENMFMQQLLWADLQKTMGEFRNLTRTTANTATRQFENALDIAQTQISTGGMAYKSPIRNGIKSLTLNGIKVIEYPTGHVDYLDVAFRRAALTGTNQTALKIQERRLEEMGCSVVETSAHHGARPDHALWQGRRFFWREKGGYNPWGYHDFITSTGYGTGPGLGGWNCRHSWFPIPDPDAPYASDFSKIHALNDREVTYNGQKMSLYDATQRQRAIERQIRRWKREDNACAVASDAAKDPDKKKSLALDSWNAHEKTKYWQSVQRDFIKQTGLKRDYFRERAGKQYVE